VGLVRVQPQRVEHTDGWAVSSAGREQIAGRTGRTLRPRWHRPRTTVVLALRSTPCTEWTTTAPGNPVQEPERSLVLDRIVEGLEAVSSSAIERDRPADEQA